MTVIQGFKVTRTDGTTHNGYRWPLPMPGERIRVDAANPSDHGDSCPEYEGDGLCVALTAKGASSEGIGLASCIGLTLEYTEDDVLARDIDKCRVRGVWVTGVFDVLSIIRNGLATNLRGANLRDANLRVANLRYANLQNANLWDADLRGANLQNANLRYANLWDANLRDANLWDANLRGADLRVANLRGADLRGAVGRDDWDDLIARGAIR